VKRRILKYRRQLIERMLNTLLPLSLHTIVKEITFFHTIPKYAHRRDLTSIKKKYKHTLLGKADDTFYNDFDDFGDDPNEHEERDAQLSRLIEKSAEKDFRKKLQIEHNWRRGNWKVRGFALDASLLDIPSNKEIQDVDLANPRGRMKEFEDDNCDRIHVCKVIQDFTSEDNELIIVGRTDGSVLVVRLGNEDLASFTNVPKASMDEETSTIRVSSEMVRSDKPQNLEENSIIDNDSTPFEILCQVKAHNEAISAMLMEDGILYSAAGKGIKIWELQENGLDISLIALREIKDIHTERIHTLKSISTDYGSFVVSVSRDGSFSLMDKKDGSLFRKIQVKCDGTNSSILSADIDKDLFDHQDSLLYLGLSDGYIIAYAVSHIVNIDPDSSPVECCKFKGHENAVTALKCAGLGLMVSTSTEGNKQVGVLLSGGSDGGLKQW